MTTSRRRPVVAALASLTLLAAAACGSDEESSSETQAPAETDAPAATEAPAETDAPAAAEASTDAASEPAAGEQPAQAEAERPTIVVTTNILGDVVGDAFGESAEVVTIMPVGTDPHDFQASAQEVDLMMNADALIVNGAGLEEGLLDVIETAEAEGVPTFEAISAVQTIEFGEGGHDDGDEEHGDDEHSDEEHGHDHGAEEKDEEHGDEELSDEEHSDDEHSDEDKDEHGHDHGHDHSGVDPPFWLDPIQMAAAVNGIVGFVQSEVALADPASLEASAAAYIAELEALDAASAAQFDTIPAANKVLVTNHDNLGYFADHYGFELAGAVIPSASTLDVADAGELAELAELIEAEGVPAIFADNSASDELAQVLADEVGGVVVVELYTGSLGEPGSDGETYLLMMSANAERISSSLA